MCDKIGLLSNNIRLCCLKVNNLIWIIGFITAVSIFFNNKIYAQSDYWIPLKSDNISESSYSHNVININLSSEALKDPTTSNFWKAVHTHNLFLAYLGLYAPEDTISKYFNLALATSLDYSCYFLTKKEKKGFIDYLISQDSTLGSIYSCRCNWLFSSYDSLLIKQLDTIYTDDQEIRILLDQGSAKIPKGSAQERKMWLQQAKKDSINQEKIEKIIMKHGYPGRRLVGWDHAEIVFSVIQHAPLYFQEKYLYLILASANSNDIEQYYPAFLIDKIKLQKKEKQIFGTQFIYNSKTEKMELYPVENKELLNQRRYKYGLPPIEIELKRMGINSDY